jgi:hypothetical protein
MSERPYSAEERLAQLAAAPYLPPVGPGPDPAGALKPGPGASNPFPGAGPLPNPFPTLSLKEAAAAPIAEVERFLEQKVENGRTWLYNAGFYLFLGLLFVLGVVGLLFGAGAPVPKVTRQFVPK